MALKHEKCGFVGEWKETTETVPSKGGTVFITSITCPQCKTKIPVKKIREYDNSSKVTVVEGG